MFVIKILQSNSIILDLIHWDGFGLYLLDTLYLFTYWQRMNWLQFRLLLEVFLANANQQLVLER